MATILHTLTHHLTQTIPQLQQWTWTWSRIGTPNGEHDKATIYQNWTQTGYTPNTPTITIEDPTPTTIKLTHTTKQNNAPTITHHHDLNDPQSITNIENQLKNYLQNLNQ